MLERRNEREKKEKKFSRFLLGYFALRTIIRPNNNWPKRSKKKNLIPSLAGWLAGYGSLLLLFLRPSIVLAASDILNGNNKNNNHKTSRKKENEPKNETNDEWR